MSLVCPENGFLLNSTCACNPGYFLKEGLCQSFIFRDSNGDIVPETSSFSFKPKLNPNIYDTDSGVSQTIFLIITLSLLGVWIGGTLYLRALPLRGIFFTLRRYVSILDYAFSKKHWIVCYLIQNIFSIISYVVTLLPIVFRMSRKFK